MPRDPNRPSRPTLPTTGSDRSPVKLAPASDPAETVERVLTRRQLIVEEGDIMVVREVAGIWHAGPGLTSPTTVSRSQYRIVVRGQRDDESERVFAKYDRAVMDGEVLAANRRVRLFYSEDNAITLLRDYRPAVSA
jgi:hypothetical protein